MTLDVNTAGPLRGELVETLPSSWYTDPGILEIERRTIFAKTWQYVGTTDAIAEVGDYFTATLVDVPVIVSRAADGVHAMVNACRHRFTPVAYGSGNTRRFSCPYHAWTYTLDGALCAAPRSDQIENFDLSEFPLKALPVATWGPLVFVSLNPDVEPFDRWIAPLAANLRDAGCEIDSLVLRKRTTFEFKGNWKIVAENYLECYHCKVAHPAYAKSFDVNRSEGYPFSMDGEFFISQTAPQDKCIVEPSLMPYDSSGPIKVNQNDMIWPNVAPTIWPGQNNLLLFTWMPVSVGETIGYFDYFFAPDWNEKAAHGLMDFLDEVGAEDKGLIESVQRGVTGNQIETGRLIPDEGQVTHFQNLVRDAVTR